jgi:hypothetical protein
VNETPGQQPVAGVPYLVVQGRDAPAIYGGLLVTTLLAVQWRFDASVEFVGFSIIVSVAVFWLTHVWVELVDRRMSGPISRADAMQIAREQAPMLAAAVPPVLVLGLAVLGLATAEQAIAIALVVAIAQLFLWGLRVGHALGRGWGIALGVAAIDCALGLVIVVLKVLVIH